MASASSIATLAKLFKTVYIGKDLSNQSVVPTPAYDAVGKFPDFYGEQLVFPFNQDVPAGIASTKFVARANSKASTFDRWVMSSVKPLFSILTIDSLSMFRAQKDPAAWLELRKKETDEAIDYFKMTLGGHFFWGDGTGALATTSVDPGVTTSAAVITLAQSTDTVKFHIGQVLVGATTASPAVLLTDKYTVTGINRLAGTITADRTTGATPNDWTNATLIFQEGTFGAAPLGVQSFIPAADPGTGVIPATLLGMTRTNDVTMKSGWRLAWQGSIEESAKMLISLMGQYFKKQSSVLWLSHYNWLRLEQELSSQGRKVIDARATQVFGSPALLLLTPYGEIPVMADPYCPSDVGFVLDMSTWEVHHNQPLIHIVDDDGRPAIRQTDDDGIEIDLRSYSEMICQRPYRNGRFVIV